MLKSILSKILLMAVFAFAISSCAEEEIVPTTEENVAFSSNSSSIKAEGRAKDPGYNRFYKEAFIVKIKENRYSVGGVLENGRKVWPGGKQTVVNTVESLGYDALLKKYVLKGTKDGKQVTLVGAPNGHRNWLPMAVGDARDPRYNRTYRAAFVTELPTKRGQKKKYSVAGIVNNKIIWPGGKQVLVYGNSIPCLEYSSVLRKYILTGRDKDGKKITLIGAPNGHRNWKPHYAIADANGVPDPRYGRSYASAFIVKIKEGSYSVGGITTNGKTIWPGGKQTLVNEVTSLTYDWKTDKFVLKGVKDGKAVTLAGAPNGHRNWQPL